MSFVHLHVHSHFSLLEASCRINGLVKKASGFEMPALALTDHGNMFGAVEFYFACKDKGIKPIIGLDAYIAPKGRRVKGEDREAMQMPNRRIVLLAQNLQGYKNLCKISTIGFQEGFYYKPRIDEEVLKEYGANLIVLSGSSRGIIPSTFVDFGPEKALEKIKIYRDLFPERFYLELVRTQVAGQRDVNAFLIEASKITGVPLVASNDIHYLERDESIAQEVLVCIGTNKTLSDESRYKLGSQEFYFKGAEQMKALFEDVPEAVENTLRIAEQCNVQFKFKDDHGKPVYHLPTYPTPPGVTLRDEMKRISLEGLEKRFEEAKVRGEAVPEEKKPDYFKRLDFEIDIIDRMGFVGYFLIVQDFIGWAKDHAIPVGPGRGSGAGSLVAYCLRITDLDPLNNALLFERFLNPERISMPDFDIDFCQDRRQEVIQYVNEKYRPECVSQIITFGKLQTKAAIRDVGRVLGMTFSEVDVIAKLVPEKLGITLDEALEMEPRITALMEEDPKINNLINFAKKIEGLNRHAGIHAAGVIISDKPLVEHAPLYKTEDGSQVVQFDMKHAEKIGLIKFDFLGLKTLTLINDALNFIAENRHKHFTTAEISVKDPGIYEILSKGDTDGVFQFEGDGISDLITRVRPSSFEDITAINALYRPGPMQMLDEYIGRKHGKIKVSYIFPELEEILKETYGILVYQEQVMMTAARIANYSLGEADMLRRAMGKKNPVEMAQQRTRFLEGAKQNGYDSKKSEELFDLMAKFAEYGFNKSHAAAYCVVAAQTAWLKNYYAPEFYAAMLSTEMSDTDKIVRYIKDARSHKIPVRAPHVNFSKYKFSVSGEEIFFSLGAIKGVGQSAVEAIVEAREAKPAKKFESLQDLFESVDLRRLNKKVIECLIKAGALDHFGAHRAQLMAGYAQMVEWAEQGRIDKELGQGSLFETSEETKEEFTLPDVKPWKRLEQLSHEKDVLGFYLSGHPLDGLGGLFRPWVSCELSGLKHVEHKGQVIVAGLITGFREIITKKGTRMAFATLEDLSGSSEVIIFPDVYAKTEALLKSEFPVFITGTVDNNEGEPKVLAETITSIEDQNKKVRELIIRIDGALEDRLPQLKELMDRFRGNVGVTLQLDLPDSQRTVMLSVNDPEGVVPSRDFFDDVQALMGRTDFIELRV